MWFWSLQHIMSIFSFSSAVSVHSFVCDFMGVSAFVKSLTNSKKK